MLTHSRSNYLENETSFLASLLIAGLRFPIASTVLGAGWIVSRILYAVGYTNPNKENGKGRLIGLTFWLFQVGLYGMVGYTGVKMLL
jgi:glutathione S-transferase